jgi:histidine triad (HIT) family protein
MVAMAARCPFCNIVSGDSEAEVVHSSDSILAFQDTNPQAPTHVLLIPKEHVPSMRELGEDHAEMLAELFASAAHIARAEGVDESGWRMVANVGRDAGQSVDHLHFHLLGGRRMRWPPG